MFDYSGNTKFVAMKAKDGSLGLLDDPRFGFQYKYNGNRIIHIKDFQTVRMMGRSWINDFAPRYPEIVEDSLKILPAIPQYVMDGELCFFDDSGKDVFYTALAKPETVAHLTPVLVLFDYLYLGQIPLKDQPLRVRNSLLLKAVIRHNLDHIKVAPLYVGTGSAVRFFQWTGERGSEGIMLKSMEGEYQEGGHGGWFKLKHTHTEDCVCVGFTEGEGVREYTFGAMMIAQYNSDGYLVYVGKISGFTDSQLVDFYNRMSDSTIAAAPVINPRDAPPTCIWCAPEIAVEVKVYRRTEDDKFISPSFIRERDDKDAMDCVMS